MARDARLYSQVLLSRVLVILKAVKGSLIMVLGMVNAKNKLTL